MRSFFCGHAYSTELIEHILSASEKQTKLDGNLPANPVNDRRIANAVTKDGSTVRYVQNLRTTYLEPYRTNVPYPYHYKKSVPYQRTFLGPHFGGSPGGWYPQIMSKYFSLKYLLISKKTGTLG